MAAASRVNGRERNAVALAHFVYVLIATLAETAWISLEMVASEFVRKCAFSVFAEGVRRVHAPRKSHPKDVRAFSLHEEA